MKKERKYEKKTTREAKKEDLGSKERKIKEKR